MDDKLIKNILTDIRVELLEEFDRNFERKRFFDQKWKKSKNGLVASGKLRRSIQAKVVGNSVVFTSSMPYAKIHNEGGTITVTAKMKRYFWAQYIQTSGNVKTLKSGKQSTSKKNIAIGQEAEMWRRMALMKVGSKITMPKRQFIGNHPRIREAVNKIAYEQIHKSVGKTFENLKKKYQ